MDRFEKRTAIDRPTSLHQLRSVLRADLMIGIAISAEAFEAIARTLPLGTVRAEFRCMT